MTEQPRQLSPEQYNQKYSVQQELVKYVEEAKQKIARGEIKDEDLALAFYEEVFVKRDRAILNYLLYFAFFNDKVIEQAGKTGDVFSPEFLPKLISLRAKQEQVGQLLSSIIELASHGAIIQKQPEKESE